MTKETFVVIFIIFVSVIVSTGLNERLTKQKYLHKQKQARTFAIVKVHHPTLV